MGPENRGGVAPQRKTEVLLTEEAGNSCQTGKNNSYSPWGGKSEGHLSLS